MISKYLLILFLLLAVGTASLYYFRNQTNVAPAIATPTQSQNTPLSIINMRKRAYPGSDLTIEQTLSPGSNYRQYIASYMSDGLKIYGLLTIPDGAKPPSGWPVIIFNHGYIPAQQYRTTERYIAYVDAFARNGYIVFKSDYRGNGSSEGKPEGAYYSHALASVKRYEDADPNRIGMWGHSMGGNITLRDMVVDTKDIKAAVIWGGVVGSYNDLMNNWQRHVSYQPPPNELANRNNYRQNLIAVYGTPATNPEFWNSIDPTAHLADITAPVQLHTGGSDEEVPVTFSQNLFASLQKIGKTVEYYNYPGGDHNISSPNFELAMQRSVDFFNRNLK
jgi:uncharacterized protein